MRSISGNAKIFSIRIWQEGEDFFGEVKKILKDFAPNREYDKKETEETPELSLQTGEIFEYFISASKSPSLSTEDIRNRLIELGFDDGAPIEILNQRIAFVDRFLSHIFG